MLGDRGLFERSAEDYVPYAGHITERAVLLMDGSVMAMARLHGVPFELESVEARNGREKRLNSLLRSIADDNITVCTHLVRSSTVLPLPEGRFASNYARTLGRDYEQALLTDLRQNAWFVSIVILPRLAGTRTLKRWSRKAGRKLALNEGAVRQLEDVMQNVLSTLSEYAPERLGLREVDDVLFSEIGEALVLIRTAMRRDVPVVCGSLGASIYTERTVCDRRAQRFTIHAPGRTRVGSILSFREYPAKTRAGMLNGLLGAPYDLVLSQSFRFRTRAQAAASLGLQERRMENSGDRARSQIIGLAEAQDDVASGHTVMGQHHISLAVYSDRPRDLETHVADAASRISAVGPIPVVEDRGMEAAYWAQLPGVTEWRTRPGDISSRNFAHMSSLENFPRGEAQGYWGPPVARFRTTGGTPFDLQTHVEDVGHTMVLGRTGRGKTLYLSFILAQIDHLISGGRGTVIFIDKDRGAELAVRAVGGRYLPLHRNRASGLAPLKVLEDTPGNRAWLQATCLGLIELDGKGRITTDEERRLTRGISRQMQLPAALRSFGGIREFLGYSSPEGAGARFERFCRGGEMGWLFDNEEDRVRLDANALGFDLTELVPADEAMTNDGAAGAAAAYLIHRTRDIMDGRRVAMFCDECRFYLGALGGILEDMSLTGRKKELMLWLAAQEPQHFLSDPHGPSLISQAQTKIIFPNGTASRSGYVDGIGLTEAEFDQVTGDMLLGTARRFLVKRETGSVVCDFDLSGLPAHIAILSGRVGTVRLLERVLAEHGDDPDAWLSDFNRRVANGEHRRAFAEAAE